MIVSGIETSKQPLCIRSDQIWEASGLFAKGANDVAGLSDESLAVESVLNFQLKRLNDSAEERQFQ